jgi:lysozyme
MKISTLGLDLIRRFEGLVLHAYRCPAGKLTIGYGHTGVDVKEGQKIDVFQADALLRSDLERFEKAVNKLVTAPLTQSQYDALVCFTYNVGEGNFKASTLLKVLNKKDYDGALGQFIRWNKAGNHVLTGLTARREAEQELFMSKSC